MSGLVLANIEALATGESGDCIVWGEYIGGYLISHNVRAKGFIPGLIPGCKKSCGSVCKVKLDTDLN